MVAFNRTRVYTLAKRNTLKYGGYVMVYPRANTLDEEIWELMRDIVFSYESKQIKALTTLKCGRKG